LQILKEYLRIRQGGSDDYLFSSSTGTKMLESSVGHNIAEYNRARCVLKTSMHLFRHTFSKNFILHGGDVFRLQKQLGHSTLDMSRRYANIWDTDLQQGFEQFNLMVRLSTQNHRIRMK
jgi:integrase/recombinase XerD